MATSKQDRQGARTVSESESRNVQRFSKLLGLIDDTRAYVDSVESSLNDTITEQSTTLKRDTASIVAEAVKKCATEDEVNEISAKVELMAGQLSITAGDSNGTLSTIINKDGVWKSEYVQNSEVVSSIRFDFSTGRFVFDGDVVVGDDLKSDITKITKATLETTNITAKYLKLAGSININDRFIVDASGNVTLPDNASISWGQVNNKPSNLATTDYVTGLGYQTATQVTQITKDTVTTSYVNALKIKAGSVDAENITGTTITGKVLSGVTGDFSGTVTATYLKAVSGGNIAGWTIDDNSMRIGTLGASGSMWLCNTGTTTGATIGNGSGSGWCIAVADKFGVKKDGTLYGEDVDLIGKITATSGQIGGWYIEDDCLASTQGAETGVRLNRNNLEYVSSDKKTTYVVPWITLFKKLATITL